MLSLKIPKGQSKSDPYILGNFEVASILSPSHSGVTLTLECSFDGNIYAPLYQGEKKLEISLDGAKFTALDTTSFEGVQYFYLSVDRILDEDLEFLIYLKSF